MLRVRLNQSTYTYVRMHVSPSHQLQSPVVVRILSIHLGLPDIVPPTYVRNA